MFHVALFALQSYYSITTMSASRQENPATDSSEMVLPQELVSLALGLLQASQTADLPTVQSLLDKGAPAWYQDEPLGWSCLHYAAERRDYDIMKALLGGGAVWNAVDKWGRTAGEISLSLGDQEGWEMIRNEGIRSGQCALADYLLRGIPTERKNTTDQHRNATSHHEGIRRRGYDNDITS